MIEIEIWSDVNCPFCYIGKKNLETALGRLNKRSDVSIRWRSFELDPHTVPPKGADQLELLSKKYGKDRSWVVKMNENVTQMAHEAGLEFHMEKLIPANTFNAHRLLHLALQEGKQDAMKESLLKAKFIEGRDIGDVGILTAMAHEVGLPSEKVTRLFETDMFKKEVRQDEEMAGALGIRGVPFFVINKRTALNGARPPEDFEEVLAKL